MKPAFPKLICRLLIASTLALLQPPAHAALIATDQVAASVSGTQSDRTALLILVSRADVATQLQTRGIDARMAQARVESMTDDEVRALKGQIESLPAGEGWFGLNGVEGAGVGLSVLVLVLFFFFRWLRSR